jgi:hypothetical protein
MGVRTQFISLTSVHFVFSTPKEEENAPASVDNITDDDKGRWSDDDFDIGTPFRKGNNTVINCYMDISSLRCLNCVVLPYSCVLICTWKFFTLF